MVYKEKLNSRDLKILIGLTTIILFFSYSAMLSYDIFNYIATAKVLFFYNENPYLIMPIEFIGEPYLLFTRAANKTALYGPFWLLLTGFPFLFGLGKFLLILMNFKFLIVVFYLATISMIWKISKNLISVYLFALNPLIVIETLIGNHNDIVMIYLALLSFSLVMKKKLFLAIAILTLSVLIKYSTIFLIPIFGYMIWKMLKNEKINTHFIFFISALSMTISILYAPIREEIYPWYFIWPLTFVFLVYQKKLLLYLSIAFSFSLLLRYIPFMLTGNYFGITPTVKSVMTFIPPIITFICWLVGNKFRVIKK